MQVARLEVGELRDATRSTEHTTIAPETALTSTPATPAAAASLPDAETRLTLVAAQLVNEYETLRRVKATLERLALVEPLVAGQRSGEWERTLTRLRVCDAVASRRVRVLIGSLHSSVQLLA